MKHQQVSVDYWTMGKSMLSYMALAALCWLMLRLFNTVFMLPRRLRSQQDQMQKTLQELQKRFPDLNITEEDLLNADKELDELLKADEEKKPLADTEKDKKLQNDTEEENQPPEECKKTI